MGEPLTIEALQRAAAALGRVVPHRVLLRPDGWIGEDKQAALAAVIAAWECEHPPADGEVYTYHAAFHESVPEGQALVVRQDDLGRVYPGALWYR